MATYQRDKPHHNPFAQEPDHARKTAALPGSLQNGGDQKTPTGETLADTGRPLVQKPQNLIRPQEAGEPKTAESRPLGPKPTGVEDLNRRVQHPAQPKEVAEKHLAFLSYQDGASQHGESPNGASQDGANRHGAAQALAKLRQGHHDPEQAEPGFGLGDDKHRSPFAHFADLRGIPRWVLLKKWLEQWRNRDGDAAPQAAPQRYTLTSKVNLRQQATTGSGIVTELPAGTVISILSDVAGTPPNGQTDPTWCSVRVENEAAQTGFVYGPLVGHHAAAQTGPAQGAQSYTLTQKVNMRPQADATAEPKTELDAGTVLTIEGEVKGTVPAGFTDDTWCQVRLADGRTGFVYGPLVGRGNTASTTGDGGSTSWAAGDKGYTTYTATMRSEANTTSAATSLPGGANFDVLGVVQGGDYQGSTTWLQVQITYSSSSGLVNTTGYLHSSIPEKGDGSTKGHSQQDLVAMLGQSTVDGAAWTNQFSPGYGGPDFFGPGRYGGQCTWFAQALRGAPLPSGNAGYGDWATDSRVTYTPAVGLAYLTPGHVAIVRNVSGQSPNWTITLAESNWGSPGQVSTGRSVNINHNAEGKPDNGGWFI